jgi:hypothetical protein
MYKRKMISRWSTLLLRVVGERLQRKRLTPSWKKAMDPLVGQSLSSGIPIGLTFAVLPGNRDS